MTKSEFVKAMYEKSQSRKRPIYINEAQAAEALADITDIISEAVKSGDNVVLTGFGTFCTVEHAERDASVPGKPGEKVHVPAKKVVKFRPGRVLARDVAGI